MRNWFPFTDYDFYAYLASGFLLLFAGDYAITGGEIMLREEWTFVEIVFAVGMAYISGQIAASPSSMLLEYWLGRRVFRAPIAILLEAAKPNWHERLLGTMVIGRYYEPLPQAVREAIYARAASELGCDPNDLKDNPETVFQAAFSVARESEDRRQRVDDFRNQYGFNRNVAFVAIIATIALALRGALTPDEFAWVLAGLAAVVVVGTLARFFKFYAAFAAEVLGSLAKPRSNIQ